MTINKNVNVNNLNLECYLDKFLAINSENKSYVEILNSYKSSDIKGNIETFQKLKDLLKLAEKNLKHIESFAECESETVHLDEPLYFDDRFDPDIYIKELVRAKINNCNIVINRTTPKICIESSIVKKSFDRMDHSGRNIRMLEINAERVAEKMSREKLSVHTQPGINIRSQLMEQKYPPLDIYPTDEGNSQRSKRDNIVVINYQHNGDKTEDDKVKSDALKSNEEFLRSKSNEFVTVNHSKKIKFDVNDNSNRQMSDKNPSYLFLNRKSDPSESYTKKNISKLKKFGIPIIQQIYNPKSNFVPRRSNTKYQSKSYINPHIRESHPLPGMSDFNLHKSCKNTEYIPYSKLTIRGISSDDIQSHVSLFKSTKLSYTEDSNTDKTESQELTNRDKDESVGKFLDECSSTTSTETPIEQNDAKLPKNINLKMKDKVDIYNYVHVIEKKDSSTQCDRKCLPKFTQTCDLNDQSDKLTIDMNKITIADMITLEKTLTSFKSKLSVTENQKCCKDTQTTPSKSVHMMTSPARMVDRNLSPFQTPKIEAQTSPIFTSVDQAVGEDTSQSNESSFKRVPLKKTPKKTDKVSLSDTYTDVSHSETSEAHSLGEINLKIIKKRIVRILNQSQSTSASFSTSINSDIHMDTTNSSKNSEGEIIRKMSYKL